jgi:O-Antigen ligase
MSYENTVQRLRPDSLLLFAGLTALALMAGCLFALSGIAGIYVATGVALLALFTAVAAKYPAPALGVAIWFLGLFPFSWGIQTGVLPKIFGDESVLLLYLMAFPLLYLMTGRAWQKGFSTLYIVLAAFVCTQALSFTVGRDLVASRNFLETYALGAVLLVLVLQEAANSNSETIANSVVWLTIAIAVLSIVERIVQRNPVMEHAVGMIYLSPELARITEGVYRPYVSFFHPSEAGTFMALGVPFAVRRWMQRRRWLSLLGLATIAGGLLVNATRGVWFGVAIATLLLVRNAWLVLAAITPIAAVGGTVAYLAFEATPFMQRLTDPNNLYSRFVYWSLSMKIFVAHPILGVGHMQFGAVYLDYVRDLSNAAHFDIAKVSVADNMYLTTTVEHGALGLATLLGVVIAAALLLKSFRTRLLALGRLGEAGLAQCALQALVIYAATGCFADLDLFTKSTKYIFILVGLGLGAGARYLGTGSDAAKTAAREERAIHPELLADTPS